ncbi:MAG: hypothetical protein IT427_00030 [Pirellulales bacterium]|nr:hypothetical protein [Pirellulales bacterium]
MLVVISDLHLTDGTVGQSIPAGAFQLFAQRLREMAVAASFRTGGLYRPIEQIDLLLLGDVLDLIRSAQWLKGDVRPWHDPQSPAAAAVTAKIVTDVLAANQRSLAVLRSMATDGIAIPSSDPGEERLQLRSDGRVPVRIHYLVGNHDWMLHLPGPAYDRIRQTVARHMALANRLDRPFAHDPAESDEILALQHRHQVLARHGDIYDPFNFEGDRNASSLGDAIVIELINRFALTVEAELGGDLSAETLAGLREIDNVRPTLLVPVWIDGLLERTCPLPATRKRVKQIWDALADRFLQLDFVRSRDTWNPVDLVDGLQRVLKFSRRLSMGWASAIVNWLHGLRGSQEASYYRHALTEQDFRNRRAKHVVYGHTHHAESVPLDVSYAGDAVLNQVYFNSGTWRRVHRPTNWAAAEHEFIPADSMTFLSFFTDDERRGRHFETWSGTLGIAAASKPERLVRLDAPHIAIGAERHVPAPSWTTTVNTAQFIG